MRFFVLIFIVLYFSKCKTSKLAGEYEWNGEGRITLFLKPDHSFIYKSVGGMSVLETKGIWKKKDSTISLKSLDSYHNYSVKEYDSAGLQGTIIRIVEKDGIGNGDSYVILNNDTSHKYFTDQNGIILVPKSLRDFKFFSIYSSVNYDRHYRKNMKANFFDIVFNASDNQFYIEDEYIIKGGDLYFPEYKIFFKKKR